MSTGTVVIQTWMESERGWGVRPDGYSLHRTNADLEAYVKKYWDGMPDKAPAEYSRPAGDPKLIDLGEEDTRVVWLQEHPEELGYRSYGEFTNAKS